MLSQNRQEAATASKSQTGGLLESTNNCLRLSHMHHARWPQSLESLESLEKKGDRERERGRERERKGELTSGDP